MTQADGESATSGFGEQMAWQRANISSSAAPRKARWALAASF